MTPENIKKLYEDGFQGAPVDYAQHESLFEDGIVKTGIDIDHLVKTNPGKGKRAFLWRSREKFDPGAFGMEPQTRGSCVSHGSRSARDTTRCVEIHIKGESEEYYKRGATEPTYMARGHNSEGMVPAKAARFESEYGFLFREKYPFADLTNLNERIANPRYLTDELKVKCKDHNVGEYLTPQKDDQAMALFYNGYSCHSGQNIGFKDNPNSKGIHERSGSWNHDMATVGYDDTKEIWDRRVYFVTNSWGRHNAQWSKWINDATMQHILGSPITGMIVVDASVWEKYFLGGRSIYFYSDIKGFPTKNLPDYGAEEFL